MKKIKIILIAIICTCFSVNSYSQLGIRSKSSGEFGTIVSPDVKTLIKLLKEYKNNYYELDKSLKDLDFKVDHSYLENTASYAKFRDNKCSSNQAYLNFDNSAKFYSYNLYQYKEDFDCKNFTSLLFDPLYEELKNTPKRSEGLRISYFIVSQGEKYTITIFKKDDNDGLMESATIFYGHK